MGTNYYLKRSAAGLYCWDCEVTLCKDGIDAIHYGRSEWYDACPKCLKAVIKEDLTNSSAGQMLGFAPDIKIRPSGVRSVCSFTWARYSSDVHIICTNALTSPVIQDEYGRDFTGQQFKDMLHHNCPIRFYDLIGREFS